MYIIDIPADQCLLALKCRKVRGKESSVGKTKQVYK